MAPDTQCLRWFDRGLVPVLEYLAALDLVCLTLLTCVDVIGRYFMGRPVYGGFELTEIMLAGVIFAALPLVSLRNEHVSVDLFDAVTPNWLFRIQHVMACLIGAVCTAYLAWRLWLRAETMMAAGETTGQLRLPLGWLTYWMSVLMMLNAVVLVMLAFRRPARHTVEARAL